MLSSEYTHIKNYYILITAFHDNGDDSEQLPVSESECIFWDVTHCALTLQPHLHLSGDHY